MSTRWSLFIVLLMFWVHAEAEERLVPRNILVIYDGKEEESIRVSRAHKFFQMPLNHLGLIAVFHDIREGLPNFESITGLRGVLTVFTEGTILDDPDGFLEWASDVVDAGYPFVIANSFGFLEYPDGSPCR